MEQRLPVYLEEMEMLQIISFFVELLRRFIFIQERVILFNIIRWGMSSIILMLLLMMDGIMKEIIRWMLPFLTIGKVPAQR